MKTFNEIRIDLIKIEKTIEKLCNSRDGNCFVCPLRIGDYLGECALGLLHDDIDYYFDNINDIAEYFRSEEE